MQTKQYLVGLALAALTATGCARDGALNGEVFIVTNSGVNLKLGSVTVAVISESVAQNHLNVKKSNGDAEIRKFDAELLKENAAVTAARTEADKLKRAVDPIVSTSKYQSSLEAYNTAAGKAVASAKRLAALEEQKEYYTSGRHYFDDLPSSVAVAKTDADGKFTLKMPRVGTFAVTASASRLVGEKTETYNWMVWTSLDGQPSKRLMLSNDNMVGAGSADSAVK